MPEIRPFNGIFYNQDKVRVHDVVAPPYDVISPDRQAKLYDRSPNNIVRLILGKESNRYESAASYFAEWRKESILVRDEVPALYVLHQRFQDENDITVTRKGIIALCRLEEFDKNIVVPHEKTLAKPREDRLRLFKATKANFSQIFSLYSDPEKEVDHHVNGILAQLPAVDVIYEDVQSVVWRVQDGTRIGNIQKVLRSKQVMIADGHHRYETALAYRDFMRSQNAHHTGDEYYNYVMMFFSNIDDEGLVIYPTHRLVHSLSSFDAKAFLERVASSFIVRQFKDEEAVMAALKSSSVPSFAVVMNGDPSLYLLSLKPTLSPQHLVKDPLPAHIKELDVTVLHSVLLRDILGISFESQERKENIEYMQQYRDAFRKALEGEVQLAFVMNATKIQQVRSVAQAGHTMPQKSTYFYPKLVSGLILHSMFDAA